MRCVVLGCCAPIPRACAHCLDLCWFQTPRLAVKGCRGKVGVGCHVLWVSRSGNQELWVVLGCSVLPQSAHTSPMQGGLTGWLAGWLVGCVSFCCIYPPVSMLDSASVRCPGFAFDAWCGVRPGAPTWVLLAPRAPMCHIVSLRISFCCRRLQRLGGGWQ